MHRARAAVIALLLVWTPLLASPVIAHEQKIRTVILLHEGIVGGNISDPVFVQGNALWFRMEDSTENTSMVVQLDVDQDGAYNATNDFHSGTLVNACPLDENGSLIDASCQVSATFSFAANATVGEYTIWLFINVSGQETVQKYTVMVFEDVHTDTSNGPGIGDCFGAACQNDDLTTAGQATDGDGRAVYLLLATIGLLGMVALINSIAKERRLKAPPSLAHEEE